MRMLTVLLAAVTVSVVAVTCVRGAATDTLTASYTPTMGVYAAFEGGKLDDGWDVFHFPQTGKTPSAVTYTTAESVLGETSAVYRSTKSPHRAGGASEWGVSGVMQVRGVQGRSGWVSWQRLTCSPVLIVSPVMSTVGYNSSAYSGHVSVDWQSMYVSGNYGQGASAVQLMYSVDNGTSWTALTNSFTANPRFHRVWAALPTAAFEAALLRVSVLVTGVTSCGYEVSWNAGFAWIDNLLAEVYPVGCKECAMVQQDYAVSTIASAIASASAGDVVALPEGVYSDCLASPMSGTGVVIDKPITLTVASDAEDARVVIDCDQRGRAFYIDASVTGPVVLDRITIQRGSAWSAPSYERTGHAIFSQAANVTLSRVTIEYTGGTTYVAPGSAFTGTYRTPNRDRVDGVSIHVTSQHVPTQYVLRDVVLRRTEIGEFKLASGVSTAYTGHALMMFDHMNKASVTTGAMTGATSSQASLLLSNVTVSSVTGQYTGVDPFKHPYLLCSHGFALRIEDSTLSGSWLGIDVVGSFTARRTVFDLRDLTVTTGHYISSVAVPSMVDVCGGGNTFPAGLRVELLNTTGVFCLGGIEPSELRVSGTTQVSDVVENLVQSFPSGGALVDVFQTRSLTVAGKTSWYTLPPTFLTSDADTPFRMINVTLESRRSSYNQLLKISGRDVTIESSAIGFSDAGHASALDSPTEQGGCIFVESSGSVTLVDTRLYRCVARLGGAVSADSSTKYVSVSGVTIEGSVAQFLGGGVALAEGVPLIVAGDSLIRSCSAVIGGGVYAAETGRVESPTGAVLRIEDGGGLGSGLGFQVSKTSTQVVHSGLEVVNCGDDAVAGFVTASATASPGSVTLTNMTVTGAGRNGVALMCSFSRKSLDVCTHNVTVSGVTVRDTRGGSGLVLTRFAFATVSDSVLAGNRNPSDVVGTGGGAVSLQRVWSLVVRRTTMTGNSAVRGGAVYQGMGSLSVVLDGVTMRNNTGREGGALYFGPGADGTGPSVGPGGVVVSGNSATTYGGVVAMCVSCGQNNTAARDKLSGLLSAADGTNTAGLYAPLVGSPVVELQVDAGAQQSRRRQRRTVSGGAVVAGTAMDALGVGGVDVLGTPVRGEIIGIRAAEGELRVVLSGDLSVSLDPDAAAGSAQLSNVVVSPAPGVTLPLENVALEVVSLSSGLVVAVTVNVSECPAGTEWTGSCVPCERGSYSGQSGVSPQCELCASGSYSNVTGSTECVACAVGTASSVTGLATECPTCEFGFYSVSEGATACRACPSLNAECSGSSVVAKPGYWVFGTSGSGERHVSRCPRGYCGSGGNGCGESREGEFCRYCAAGTTLKSGKCVACSGTSGVAVAMLIVTYIGLGAFFSLRNQTSISAKVDLIVFFVQGMALTLAYDQREPGGSSSSLWRLSLADPDFLPNTCLAPFDYYERFAFALASPVLVFGGVGVVWLAERAVRAVQVPGLGKVRGFLQRRRPMRERYTKAVVGAALFSYMPVLRTAVGALYCAPVHEGATQEYLVVDPSIDCVRADGSVPAAYARLQIVAGVVASLVFVGPAAYAGVVAYLRRRYGAHELRSVDSYVYSRFSILYASYHHDLFGAAMLLRKAVLVTIVTFAASDNGMRASVLTLYLAALLWLHVSVRPFVTPIDDKVETASLVALCAVAAALDSSQLASEGDTATTVTIVVSNVAALAPMGALLCFLGVRWLRSRLRSRSRSRSTLDSRSSALSLSGLSGSSSVSLSSSTLSSADSSADSIADSIADSGKSL